MSRILIGLLTAAALGTTTAWGHHDTNGRAHAVATVTLAQPVLAGGQPLAPGTYEIWIGGAPEGGQGALSKDAPRRVQFVQDGKVVREEIAEVFPHVQVGETAGTAGPTGMAKAMVQELKSGDYVRISVTDAGSRFLIHLPTESFSQPAPQPQEKSRIVLPPKP